MLAADIMEGEVEEVAVKLEEIGEIVKDAWDAETDEENDDVDRDADGEDVMNFSVDFVMFNYACFFAGFNVDCVGHAYHRCSKNIITATTTVLTYIITSTVVCSCQESFHGVSSCLPPTIVLCHMSVIILQSLPLL